MPLYTYEHPKTKKQVTIIQKMTDSHEYVDEKGVKWNRVFHVPQAATDTQIDPFSFNDFVKKTNNKKGTVGDLWDISADLSEKRKSKAGKDAIKEKTISDYEKKCKGVRHPFRNK